eukprot:g3039.t1
MLSGLTRSDLIVSCMRFAPVFVLRLAQCGVPFKRADAQVLEGDPQQALILPRIAEILKDHRGKLKLLLEGHQAEGEEPGTDLERSLAVYQWLVEVAGCAPGLLRLKGCGSTAGLGQLVVPVPIQELVIRSGPKPAEMEGMNFPSGLYFAKDCQHVQICFLLLQFSHVPHSCCAKDRDENPDLAGRRAVRVRELLMELGVPRTQMRPQSCKALHPLSRTQLAVNRRVELHILGAQLLLMSDRKRSVVKRPKTPKTESFQIGDFVQIGDNEQLVGHVKFQGATSFADGVWVGIQCQKAYGKNVTALEHHHASWVFQAHQSCEDGSVQGVRYFECPPKYGLFARPTSLRRLQERDAQAPASSSTINEELEKAVRKQDLQKLREVLPKAISSHGNVALDAWKLWDLEYCRLKEAEARMQAELEELKSKVSKMTDEVQTLRASELQKASRMAELCWKIEIDDDKKLYPLFDKRMAQEVSGDSLGDEFKGYIFRIGGVFLFFACQGFPMKQGVLVNHRVRLLFKKGMSCYRERRKGCRKRKSVRGCIVGPDLAVLHLVVVKKGEQDIPGLTETWRDSIICSTT